MNMFHNTSVLFNLLKMEIDDLFLGFDRKWFAVSSSKFQLEGIETVLRRK